MRVGERIRKALEEHVYQSALWKSIFRHGYPDSDRNRVLAVLSNVFLHLHPTQVAGHAVRLRYTWCMGGLAAFLFLHLTVSGVFLMFYYRPTPEYAYADMMALREDVPLGMFMRNVHRWAAHAMVIVVWLHMLRVFLTGSYKRPREFNWVVGVALLTLTLLLSFTGNPTCMRFSWRLRRPGWRRAENLFSSSRAVLPRGRTSGRFADIFSPWCDRN